MRAAWILVASLGCGSSSGTAPARPAPEPAPAAVENSCGNAAHGILSATRGIRQPAVAPVPPAGGEPAGAPPTLADELVTQCTRDRWPVAARNCFATMHEGDLDRCARELTQFKSARLLRVLADRRSLASVQERLATVSVGLPPCDDYVRAVGRALDCDALSIDLRRQLGTEAADFYSIPMTRLDEEGRRQLAEGCVRGLEQLEAAVTGVCML